jgi:hypothetical protein
VRFAIAPDTMHIPGYHRVLGPVPAAPGRQAYLFEADTAPPYARVVPGALKVAEEQIPATLADPRLPGYDRVVFLSESAPVSVPALTAWPQPSPAPSYVLVAENWYVDWRATVDGAPAQVLRGNHALLTVPVPAGGRRVELVYRSAAYRRGQAISFVSLILVLAAFAVPAVARWRRRG